MSRGSPILLAAVLAAAVLSSPAAAGAPYPTTVFIQGTPPPQKHSPRPLMSDQDRADLGLQALIAKESPRLSSSRRLAPGEAILEVGVRHGVTGVLVSDVDAKGGRLSKKRKLLAGSSVFGIPMGGPDGRYLVWCAPQQGQVKDQPKAWTATCLPFGDKANLWVEGRPALMPVGLSWSDLDIRETNPPDVRRQAVSLPPLTLSYAFAGWDAKGWLKLEYRLDWGEGPQVLRALALAPGADGAVKVKLMGGQLALRSDAQAAANATLEVIAAPRQGAPVEF